MSNITPFSFNGMEVRATVDQDGNPLFVAKDVCAAFNDTNYRRTLSRLEDDQKGVSQIDTPGGVQQMATVNESGLYSMLFYMQPQKAARVGADLAEIERRVEALRAFRRWVTSEVLPALRKHGAYVTPRAAEKAIKDVAPEFRAAFGLAFLISGDRNASAISANQLVRRSLGVDCMAELGMTHMLSEKQERVLTPTDLGKFLNLSAIGVNKVLVQRGLQFKGPDGIWRPTEAGKPYARLFDTGKAHGSGVPVQQLKWTEDVLKAIQ
jgi:prophage antirepressor-like protein